MLDYRTLEQYASDLEDIIAQNSSQPSKLYEAVKAKLKDVSDKDIDDLLDNFGPLFGDVRINTLVKDIHAGKQVSASFVKSLDFSELADLDDKIKTVVEEVEEKCPFTSDMFESTVVEPTLVSDWDNYKHEMADSFEYPDLLISADNIPNSGKMDMLCSPVTMSLIGHCINNDQESLKSEPKICAVFEEMCSIEPSLADYVEEVANTTLTPEVTNEVTDLNSDSALQTDFSANQSLNTLLNKDFSMFDRVTTGKGLRYLMTLLTNKARKGAPALQKLLNFSVSEGSENDFSADETGIKALSEQASAAFEKAVGKPKPKFEIPTGDTAQKRGGSSAPKSQGG